MPSKTNLRKPSPLRPSPLSTGPTRSSSIDTIPSAPNSSPVRQSFRQPSISSTVPSSPTTVMPNSPGLRPPHQLRQVTSVSTLNDAMLSRQPLSAQSPPQASPSFTARNLSKDPLSNSELQPAFSPDREKPSNESYLDQVPSSPEEARSRLTSPPPTPHRQQSLRTKLSLPNLRRNRSKTDDTLTLGSPILEHDLSATVQVQDLDFELVRPTIHFQHARSSEDSGVLGRDTSVELPSRPGDGYPQ